MKKFFIALLLILISIIILLLYSFSPFLTLLPKIFSSLKNENTVLITLHNEAELRPSLGFLTGFIFLEYKNGNLNLEFHDSYDIKPPEEKIIAPEIIEKRFSEDKRYEGFVFRDSNFYLDGEKNTQELLKFLQYDERYKDKKIDAVISLDLHSIGEIIDTLGGVEFKDQKITRENLFQVLEKDVKEFTRGDEKAWIERKNEIKPLADIIIKKSLYSVFSWHKLSRKVEDLLNQKHILLYSFDENLNNYLKEKKWTGKIDIEKDSIPWGINFANMGGKKGDRYMTKRVVSTFSIGLLGEMQENMRIYIDHEGTRNLHSDRYFGYVRIIKPKGTLLKSYEGDFLELPKEKESEFEETSEFDSFFYVDESDSIVLEYKFTYPAISYSLLPEMQKKVQLISQAGIINMPVSLVFQGFANEKINVKGCQKSYKKENITWCNFIMPNSREITINREKDTEKPIFEDFDLLNKNKTVVVNFSENIQSINKKEVKILNDKEEEIEIKNIETKDRSIIINLKKSLYSKERKFYKVKIDNLNDVYGNGFKEYETTISYPKYK